jgi:hypothetical protein
VTVGMLKTFLEKMPKPKGAEHLDVNDLEIRLKNPQFLLLFQAVSVQPLWWKKRRSSNGDHCTMICDLQGHGVEQKAWTVHYIVAVLKNWTVSLAYLVHCYSAPTQRGLQ